MWNNGRMPKRTLLPLVSVALAAGLSAEVRLPALLSDRMVVQRDAPVHVWGWADPGEEVQVAFRGQQASTQASATGHWEVYLKPVQAGGPHTLTVRGTNSITLEDIHVGEVWVASGQSNMAWSVERSRDAEQEIAAANFPGIRYFKVALTAAEAPAEDVEGQWAPVSPETVGAFSGVAYFFARHLHQETDVAFGIIQSAWGGTPAEAWTSLRTLSADPALAGMSGAFAQGAIEAKASHAAVLADWERQARAAKAAGQEAPRKPRTPRALQPQQRPAALFNAMIAPLTPYPIRGSIWYQGENNAGRGQGLLYRRLFRALIEDWRRAWGAGDFPFLFVQLANFGRVSAETAWPEVREAQTMALGLARTGMAVTIDIGNSTDIHPRNKQDVGRRLALAARAIAYGETELPHSGPLFRQATREGSALRLWFDHAAGGLEARGGALEGFEVAGANGDFVAAEARIDGETVVVSNPRTAAPVAARYAWAADPAANLFNGAGLPASPFRTGR